MPAVTGRDVISFDQNWHLYSIAARGKDLSNNTQIRVIGLMEPEICTKMLKKLSEKLRAKFLATTRGYSMVKIARLKDEGQSLQRKEKKRRKRKGKKVKFKKSKSLRTLISPHARAKMS